MIRSMNLLHLWTSLVPYSNMLFASTEPFICVGDLMTPPFATIAFTQAQVKAWKRVE